MCFQDPCMWFVLQLELAFEGSSAVVHVRSFFFTSDFSFGFSSVKRDVRNQVCTLIAILEESDRSKSKVGLAMSPLEFACSGCPR